MRFFFPDSQDQVDPNFNFLAEDHHVHRVRQRDDRYAHEVLRHRPFDGLLISKSIVDGHDHAGAGRYTAAARNRLYREGAHRFFRLDPNHSDVVVMGDCGAFTYFNESEPPYTVEAVLDFYEQCGLDWGVSPDHIVFGFVQPHEIPPPDRLPEWQRRIDVTLSRAKDFIDEVSRRQSHLRPVGVAHGWSAETYRSSVKELVSMGYKNIALGGMVPLRTRDIVATLECVHPELEPDCGLHLLGITRTDEMQTFERLGVTSFDSTSPFRQAFKDDKDNYYTADETFVAIKIPQVDGNAKVKRLVSSGAIDQRSARESERRCLQSFRDFERGLVSSSIVLDELDAYGQIVGLKPRRADYERTLNARPWTSCRCGVCDVVGGEVILFRGSERNKRRGFHNLAVFRERIARLGFQSLRVTGEQPDAYT